MYAGAWDGGRATAWVFHPKQAQSPDRVVQCLAKPCCQPGNSRDRNNCDVLGPCPGLLSPSGHLSECSGAREGLWTHRQTSRCGSSTTDPAWVSISCPCVGTGVQGEQLTLQKIRMSQGHHGKSQGCSLGLYLCSWKLVKYKAWME